GSRPPQKKRGDRHPAKGPRGLRGRGGRRFPRKRLPRYGGCSPDGAVPPNTAGRGAGVAPGDQAAGASASPVWISHGPRAPGPTRVDGEHQTGSSALDRAGPETAREAAKSPKTRPEARDERQQLCGSTGPVQERRLDVRFHSRPDSERWSAQVAVDDGRIYSGVPGSACG